MSGVYSLTDVWNHNHFHLVCRRVGLFGGVHNSQSVLATCLQMDGTPLGQQGNRRCKHTLRSKIATVSTYQAPGAHQSSVYNPEVLTTVAATAQERVVTRDGVMAEIVAFAREIVLSFNPYLYFGLGYRIAPPVPSIHISCEGRLGVRGSPQRGSATHVGGIFH